MKERKRRIEQYCSDNRNSLMNWGAVEPRKISVFSDRVVFCRVNKCATTFSLHILKTLFGCRLKTCKDVDSVVLNQKSNKNRLIDEKYSFFFVREPYRRLFSTYCNKFYLPKENWAPIGPTIARMYRKSPTRDSLKYGHDVTFAELIRYTVESFEKGLILDQHLRPMYQLSSPCNRNYSYIGKLETFTSDWEAIFKDWKKMDELNVNLSVFSTPFKHNSLSEINHVFATIRLVNESGISNHSLLQRAWNYFKIVGQISKHIPFPVEDIDATNVPQERFTRVVQDAIAKSTEDKQEVWSQREEALLQAYSTISTDLLERLRAVVLVDCKMFGYEDKPDWLFNKTRPAAVTGHQYFTGSSQ